VAARQPAPSNDKMTFARRALDVPLISHLGSEIQQTAVTMAAAPFSVALLRLSSIRLITTRYLTTSICSFSTLNTTNSAVTSEPNATCSSISIAAPPTPEWQSQIQALWEQASGDAELRLLKNRVSKTSQEFDEAVRCVTQQRRHVEECQKRHEQVYQRHASLLMRREQWTPEEAGCFVDITSQEVKARQALHDARQELHNMETRASRLQQTYMDALRTKYQEEQAWQDRWRLLGTYGTWSLIGLNSLVFLFSQVLFYRREARRLKDIENLIKENLTPISAVAVVENDINESTLLAEEDDTIEAATQVKTTSKDNVAETSEQESKEVIANTGEHDASSTTTQDNNQDHPLLFQLKQYKNEIENNLHVRRCCCIGVHLYSTKFDTE
jgi:hypothetical protein